MQLTLDETGDGAVLECAPGDTLDLTLPENPTAGFRWKLAESYRPCLSLKDDTFEASDGTPGRPGRRTWRFAAKETGECEISLALVRLWQPSPATARSFRAHVKVRAK